MRAVVIATGYCAGGTPAGERYPAALLPLVDRPFIQHVVEFLIDQGVDDFDFVLCDRPEEIEGLLGDGARWGSRFRFHLARDPLRPYGTLRRLESDNPQESLLLVHADRLPHVQLSRTQPVSPAPVMFCWRDPSSERIEELMRWTGWAWLPRKTIEGLPDGVTEKELESYLLSIAPYKGALVRVPEPLTMQTYGHVLSAHEKVLTDRFPGLLLTGREVENGVRLARNVHLHPTARLEPPVYVGENSRIGAGVQLGPNASVGCNSIVDARSRVENSVILPGSYVGSNLELNDVVVDRNRLIDSRLEAEIAVPDSFILGSLADRHLSKGIAGAISRAVAGFLLALTWPVLLATAVYLRLTREGPVLRKKEVIRLPADRSRWHTFQRWSFAKEGKKEEGLRHLLLEFFPGLVNVLKGELRFVGVPPRGREAVERLARDWQTLYLGTGAGLITEAYVRYGPRPDEDEGYCADGFYAVSAGFTYNLGLVAGYIGRLFKKSVETEAAHAQ